MGEIRTLDAVWERAGNGKSLDIPTGGVAIGAWLSFLRMGSCSLRAAAMDACRQLRLAPLSPFHQGQGQTNYRRTTAQNRPPHGWGAVEEGSVIGRR